MWFTGNFSLTLSIVLTSISTTSGLWSTGNTRKYQQIDVYINQCGTCCHNLRAHFTLYFFLSFSMLCGKMCAKFCDVCEKFRNWWSIPSLQSFAQDVFLHVRICQPQRWNWIMTSFGVPLELSCSIWMATSVFVLKVLIYLTLILNNFCFVYSVSL